MSPSCLRLAGSSQILANRSMLVAYGANGEKGEVAAGDLSTADQQPAPGNPVSELFTRASSRRA